MSLWCRRLEIENARLEAAAKQQSNKIDVLQKTAQEAAAVSTENCYLYTRGRHHVPYLLVLPAKRCNTKFWNELMIPNFTLRSHCDILRFAIFFQLSDCSPGGGVSIVDCRLSFSCVEFYFIFLKMIYSTVGKKTWSRTVCISKMKIFSSLFNFFQN